MPSAFPPDTQFALVAAFSKRYAKILHSIQKDYRQKTIMKCSTADLVLASSSPRRRDLLLGLGLRFTVAPADVDENLVGEEAPEVHVSRLGLAKAVHVSEIVRDQWVLGADTVVVIDGAILGKPRDEEEALTMLSTLTGRTHEVFTGYAFVHHCFPEKRLVRHVRSKVTIREMTPPEIAGYVRTGEPLDKAGAYAIQGVGSAIVAEIDGSYTNVVGLPLCEVAKDLKKLGIFDFLERNGSK